MNMDQLLPLHLYAEVETKVLPVESVVSLTIENDTGTQTVPA